MLSEYENRMPGDPPGVVVVGAIGPGVETDARLARHPRARPGAPRPARASASEGSMPTTVAPPSSRRGRFTPVPQPTSRTRSPGPAPRARAAALAAEEQEGPRPVVDAGVNAIEAIEIAQGEARGHRLFRRRQGGRCGRSHRCRRGLAGAADAARSASNTRRRATETGRKRASVPPLRKMTRAPGREAAKIRAHSSSRRPGALGQPVHVVEEDEGAEALVVTRRGIGHGGRHRAHVRHEPRLQAVEVAAASGTRGRSPRV